VAGVGLPAAVEEEDEVNDGSLTSSCACSLRRGCAEHLVVPSDPPSAPARGWLVKGSPASVLPHGPC